MSAQDTNKGGRDRIGLLIYMIYILLLAASVLLVGKILYLEFFFKPEPKIASALTPRSVRRTLEPVRGNILDCNGRILAMSYPMYRLHLDCTVGKDEKWESAARELCGKLPEYFPGKNAKQYFEMLSAGRRNGQRYLALGGLVDHSTLNKIQTLPLLREGRNRGGLIVEQENIRRYPYGELARRTIGFVRDNKAGVTNNFIGIEGKYNHILHGKDGTEWLRETDKHKIVRDTDSSYVRAENGKDITTTLNIDYQEFADNALRDQIKEETDLEGAYFVLMDVKTGAIRVMVNLLRNPRTGKFEESSNLAIGRKIEPGSVFKTVTLTSVLSDGFIKKLDQTIPTNHGVIANSRCKPDHHIADWERNHHTNRISIIDGFKISSNYVFATLAIENYASNPMRYIERVYSYGLADAFKFDLDGLLAPTVPSPKTNPYWTNTDLGNMGFGYYTEETPLHILTFYNALAGKGRMMKPYLIDGPSVLNASICSKAVADTVTRALKAVTEEGTARCLKKAAANVAGKTGTSFGTYPRGQAGESPYVDRQGRRKYQGTFAGFFPSEDPQYSVICGVYSYPTRRSYQGAGIPARTILEVVNYLVKVDPYWQKEFGK